MEVGTNKDTMHHHHHHHLVPPSTLHSLGRLTHWEQRGIPGMPASGRRSRKTRLLGFQINNEQILVSF